MSPSLPKKNIVIIVLLALVVWLMFTSSGLRSLDSIKSLASSDNAVQINLVALNGGYTEAELKRVFPQLSWQCMDQDSAFGKRFCHAQISHLNGIPAHYLTAFLKEGVLKAMKMVYRPRFQQDMIAQVREQLGEPSNVVDTTPADPAVPHAVFQWGQKGSAVVLKQSLLAGDEAAMMWLNTARVIRQNQ